MENLKILMIISSLEKPGGAEKVFTTLANHYANLNFTVEILTIDNTSKPFFELQNEIKLTRLNLAGQTAGITKKIYGVLSRIKKIRTIVTNSGVKNVIAFGDKTNILCCAALAYTKINLIISERTDPRRHKIGVFWNIVRVALYRYCKTLVVQNASVEGWARKFLPKKKIVVIPNPIKIQPKELIEELLKTKRNSQTINLISLGRLSREKNNIEVLKIYKQVRQTHKNIKLIFVGNGPEAENLKAKTKQLNLDLDVEFKGETKSPNKEIEKADIYLSTSLYEGFPNALCECMTFGLPCVVYKTSGGASEIIDNNKNGFIIDRDNPEEFIRCLSNLISNNDLREKIGEEAYNKISIFDESKVLKAWDKLL